MLLKTVKSSLAVEITDHLIATIRPNVSPKLIMWRELINSFNAKNGNNHWTWIRDDSNVHQHFKKFSPQVINILEQRYKLTIVKVGGTIRKRLKHGASPDQSSKRTPEFYKSCIVGPSNPTMGFVAFPRNTQKDHPLIVGNIDRKMRVAASHMSNTEKRVSTATDLGTLSEIIGDEIRQHARPIANRLIEKSLPPPLKFLE